MGQEAEFYEFERIVQDLEVRRDGALVFRDHFTWDGPWNQDQACWYVGRQLAAASGGLFVTGNVELPLLGPEEPLCRVVLPLAHGDTLIRWCGPVPELTRDLVQHRLADRRKLERRSARHPLADRIEPPRTQSLVLDPGVTRCEVFGAILSWPDRTMAVPCAADETERRAGRPGGQCGLGGDGRPLRECENTSDMAFPSAGLR